MISVKDALTDLERQAKAADARERLSKKSLDYWQRSLQAVEEHVFPLFPEAASKTAEDWRQIHTCLRLGVAEEVLESAPRLVERVLHNYAQESRRTQREELESVKAILEVMASAASAARSRTDSQSGDLQGVCESLGRLAELENLDEVRRELSREAAHLRETVVLMVRENQESLAAMEADLGQFRTRLAEAEAAAATDTLTGLANRRELERQLDARIQRQAPFCVLLFDLDGFKSINDRFGHDGGDQVLRLFANVLNEQVRPGNVAARWGGDEFLAIFDCPLKDALRRCRQISEKLGRRYEINWNGKTIMIPIQASSGVVEYCRGETPADLFRRADEAMYAAKAQRVASRAE